MTSNFKGYKFCQKDNEKEHQTWTKSPDLRQYWVQVSTDTIHLREDKIKTITTDKNQLHHFFLLGFWFSHLPEHWRSCSCFIFIARVLAFIQARFQSSNICDEHMLWESFSSNSDTNEISIPQYNQQDNKLYNKQTKEKLKLTDQKHQIWPKKN